MLSVDRHHSMQWYTGWTKTGGSKGRTLLDAIDAIEPPSRPTGKPLRLPIRNVYKISGIGIVVAGRVESGTIQAAMTVNFAPANVATEVRSIEMHHEMLEKGNPGDIIGFSVK